MAQFIEPQKKFRKKIWRYMPLESFIYLLSKKKLYFSLLSSFEETDPREGYPPVVAMTALANITANTLNTSIELKEKFREYWKELPEEQFGGRVANFDAVMDSLHEVQRKQLIANHNAMIQKSAVSCWHKSDIESEAMWRIYSRNGIAIVSSLRSIKSSLACNNQDVKIFSGHVKYLDYDDKKLKPSDCVSDGFVIPLIKSNHYAHEKEFRLFMAPQFISLAEGFADPITTIDVDPCKLIEKVIISPYAKEPFISSVMTICELYNIPLDKVTVSNLLVSYKNKLEEILDEILYGRSK